MGEVKGVQHQRLVAEHGMGEVSEPAMSVTRLQRLQSTCSRKFLQIVDRMANANGLPDSPFGMSANESNKKLIDQVM